MSKQKGNSNGLVYSTDPNFQLNEEGEKLETLAPEEQLLRVTLETKHRAGKTVTLVLGFVGKEEDMQELGKKLKNSCGTGGAVKDAEIILQGDHREKVKAWLLKNRYKVK